MSDGLGNAEQVRVIADQLYDVWSSKQVKRHPSWPAWTAAVVSIGGIIFMAGTLAGDVNDANARSVENRQKIETQASAINTVNDRLARIETKIDLALEDKR